MASKSHNLGFTIGIGSVSKAGLHLPVVLRTECRYSVHQDAPMTPAGTAGTIRIDCAVEGEVAQVFDPIPTYLPDVCIVLLQCTGSGSVDTQLQSNAQLQ